MLPIVTRFNSGVIPDSWKTANVCLIFKTGEKDSPDNYRPVSLTSVVCELLKHIIYSNIV